jgi:hypothetical protein
LQLKRRQCHSRLAPVRLSPRLDDTLRRSGKIKYALVLWLMGAPMFLVVIALFARGCDF